jgi:hypothetical protein
MTCVVQIDVTCLIAFEAYKFLELQEVIANRKSSCRTNSKTFDFFIMIIGLQ